jgi:SAM-dependent methyltransferase
MRFMNRLFRRRQAVERFNCILDDSARIYYKPTIKLLWQLTPEMMRRKIAKANVQQAFVLAAVEHLANEFRGPNILCVGSFEDTAAAGLKALKYEVEEIDPVINTDLDTFYHAYPEKRGSYQIIFSTSVLEHVADDELFVSQINGLLAPRGIAIMTCDFNDQYKRGDPLPPTDLRFYTQDDLRARLAGAMPDCRLIDQPNWVCSAPDFTYVGIVYTFATIVVRKEEPKKTVS